VTASSVADPTRSASTTINVASATVQVATPALVVNVRSAPYNAKGDGITDDTAAIQAAVNAVAGTGGEVTIPAGTYLINPIANNGNAGIALGSSMTLNLEDGAVLQARSTATSGYVVLQLNGVHDVNLTGGTVLGNRDNNTITDTVEAGMGIQVKASRHVVVENMNVSNCWADGIYVVAASQDVTISQVVANNNRRNGMSIVSVSDMVVRGCTFENATGSMENGAMANGGGIDVEPNPGDTIDTVLFAGCSFRNNAAGGLGASVPVANTGLAFTRNIYVVGNTVSGNPYRGINVSNFSDAVVVNNTVTGNGQYGILFQTQATNAVCTGNSVTGTTGVPGNGIDEDSCSGNLLTGNTCTGNAGHGLVSAGCTGGAISGNTLSGNGIAP
jgi:parallel beta-helix repeat protein